MATQENCHAEGHEEYQELVEIGGREFWADPEMIPLLRALNDAGLKTRSHCCGHETGRPWVVLRMDNVETVEVRNRGEYDEVLIQWKR